MSICFTFVCTLERQNTEISKQIFTEKEYRGLSPNYIHVSVSDLYMYSHDRSSYSAGGKMWILGLLHCKSLTDT
jgi:hypothetical protein